MRPEHYRKLLSEWNDSDEPGVIVYTGGMTIQGIARNQAYGEHDLPYELAWLSTPDGDIVIDIPSIVALYHWRG